MKKHNWGIIGAGKIAGRFAEGLRVLPNANLHAIASRSAERASEFASEYEVPAAYGSWEEINKDPDIDIVYVATHHPHHLENSLDSLRSGKAVLCEKPITMNRRELEILVQAARKEGVFLMEAIWTRFLPSLHKVLEICQSRELGELQHICADFGFRLDFDPEHRIFDPAKGGGCLLDIGIYPVFLALLLAGKPLDIKAGATLAPTGIDDSCSMILKQEGNVFSSLFCTFRADAPVEANILFEKGWIRIQRMWHTPAPITLYRQGRKPELIEFPEPGNGYQYEAAEVMRCLDQGLTESPGLPLDFSLDLMGLLDRIREDCGIRYEQDFIK